MNELPTGIYSVIGSLRGCWRAILTKHGAELPVHPSRHGPCPICGGKDRFRFDDLEGRGTWICNQCGAGDGLKLFMALSGFSYPEAIQYLHEQASREPHPQLRYPCKAQANASSSARAKHQFWNIQKALLPIAGSPVSHYLTNRGLADVLDRYSELPLGMHPGLQYWEHASLKGCYPAMIAPVSDPTGKVVSLHKTYLTYDGHKADVSSPKKLMMSPKKGITRGGAIRLFPISTDGVLALAEGIETAIAVTLATGIPCWATINAGGLARIEIPDSVKELSIWADKDLSLTGERAAYMAAERLATAMRLVRVHIPESAIPENKKSIDWLDVYNLLTKEAS